jgi:serine/threonine protein kinase/tetratricopeptide (TPR) repeat protein
MPPAQNEVKLIFGEALFKNTPAEREAYLHDACSHDATLRSEVDALLAAHEECRDFLGKNVITSNPIGEGPGSIIGRYKLLQQIGEGGFGVVFMAQQQQPVRRMVALKIIKAGMDTREVIARFEAERQALALMDHPNIARVLDGGATESGRPYFVMDLVKGVPITEFCEQHRLSTESRLRLFMQVCAAVQHAHQKGIIHRDLKPTNVLVTLHDGDPIPKVIDFGISKAVGQRLTEKTLFTRFEQLMGTPSYMSPEQAEWSGLDIDTRSDIFSLGVLLYELLTGTTPLEKETVSRAALDEIRRLIREQEPERPSQRLSRITRNLTLNRDPNLSSSLPSLASVKKPQIDPDLDWIILKSLEKDRTRRYDTVNALTRDVEQHLQGEPVAACPPSTVYRARKFVRRHRTSVVLALTVTASLLLGLFLAVLGFIQARREGNRAQEQTAIANAVNDFLRNDLLGKAHPEAGLEYSSHGDVTVREVVDRAASRVSQRFTNQPLVEAAIRLTIGDIYDGLGNRNAAKEHLARAVDLRTQALGPRHIETLGALAALADSNTNRDEIIAARRRLAEAYTVTAGPDDDNTLWQWETLATKYMEADRWYEAEDILPDVYARLLRVHGRDHMRTLFVRGRSAIIAAHSGRTAEAISINEDILQKERENPTWHTSEILSQLADNYYSVADYEKALERTNEGIELMRRSFAQEHPRMLGERFFLAHLHGTLGHWKECMEQELALLPHRGLSLASSLRGAVAALLVRDLKTYAQFIGSMLDQLEAAFDPEDAAQVLRVALLNPDLIAESNRALQLAERLPAENPGLFTDNNISRGVAAYRRNTLPEALRLFGGWRTSSVGDAAQSSTAGYCSAMIHFRQGETNAAQSDLQEADKRLNALLHSGELGDAWYLYGEAAILRAEAERLIFGRQLTPIANAASLKTARIKWARVRTHLNNGDRYALEKNWPAAHDEYLAAIRDPVFSWPAAEAVTFTHNSILATRIGITFLLAHDSFAHEELCREWFVLTENQPAPGQTWHFLRTCLAAELNPSGKLIIQANQLLQKLTEESGKVTPEAISLLRTMAAYRSGKYQQAIQAAPIAGRPSVRAAAQLLRVMALAQVGRVKEAKTDLRQVETGLARPLKNLTGDLWWDLAMCQLLLNEAHQLIN